MIREIGVELSAKLKERGVPFVVEIGPEKTATASYAIERIVIGHDRDGADRFLPVRSQHPNPKHHSTRSMACVITIYAKSPRAGALQWEHDRRANDALDQVIVALDEIAQTRKNAWQLASGRFVTPDNFKDSDQAAGAVYELKFFFERGVRAQTWRGEARPEITLEGIKNTDAITTANGPEGQTPEVACG